MDIDGMHDNDNEEEIATIIVVENMMAETNFMLQLILTVVKFMIESFLKSRRKKAIKYNMNVKIPLQVHNLARLAGQTGVGWDDNANMIIVDNEEDWNVYLKKEPDAKTMRGKSFELYPEWKEIWGIDRATGVDSETPSGVAEAIRSGNGLVDEDDVVEIDVDGLDDISPFGSISQCQNGKNKNLASAPGDSKGKRKRDRDTDKKRKRDNVIEVMANQLSETIITSVNILADTQTKNMATICTRLGHEVEKSEKRRNFPTLLKELNLSEDDELDVISMMGTNDKQIDSFLGFSESQRLKWVRRLLDENLRSI